MTSALARPLDPPFTLPLSEAEPDSLAHVFAVPLDVCSASRLAASCRALQPQLADWSLVQLEEALRLCTQQEGAAFVLRGLLLHERFARVPRLRRGRGQRDEQGVGREALKRSLAQQLGTLEKDVRIVTTFFLEPAKTPALESGSFPRGFYEVALLAGEQAWEALERAAYKRAAASAKHPYTVEQFRKEVRATFPSAASKPKAKQEVRLRLDAESRAELERLAHQWQTTTSEVVRRLVAERTAMLKEEGGRRKEEKTPNAQDREEGRDRIPQRPTSNNQHDRRRGHVRF